MYAVYNVLEFSIAIILILHNNYLHDSITTGLYNKIIFFSTYLPCCMRGTAETWCSKSSHGYSNNIVIMASSHDQLRKQFGSVMACNGELNMGLNGANDR